MRIISDTTARVAVLILCVLIVIMRLLRPDIPFDACSLGALALAALIAIAPIFRESPHTYADGKPSQLEARDVEALRHDADAAGLLLADSRGEYAALGETRPLELALAGARVTLCLRLKSLTDQANVEPVGADADSCLNALNSAGITTGEQFRTIGKLLNLLALGARPSTQADERTAKALLDLSIRIIEMLDGTLT